MQQEYTNAIGLMGGVAILAFAGLQTVTIVDKNRPQYHIRHIAGRKGPFLIGLSFTALNPFFIIWWFTAGLKLITDSEEFGITTGLILLFAISGWTMLGWLSPHTFLQRDLPLSIHKYTESYYCP